MSNKRFDLLCPLKNNSYHWFSNGQHLILASFVGVELIRRSFNYTAELRDKTEVI